MDSFGLEAPEGASSMPIDSGTLGFLNQALCSLNGRTVRSAWGPAPWNYFFKRERF